MKKETMLTYLEQQLEQKLGQYDFAIDWHPSQGLIEVWFILDGRNDTGILITDATGISTEEDEVEFEDGIVFYDPQKFVPNLGEYLAGIPYEGKKGLPREVIQAVVVYLKRVLEKGADDLRLFLQSNELDVFELVWLDEEFKEILASFTSQTGYLPYPRY